MARNYESFDQLSDVRKERKAGKAFNSMDERLYNSLIDVILNHKAELRKYPEAMSRKTALGWGQKRGLRLGPEGEDLNHDGIEDVVLYNKAGNPVIINGYRAVPSDFAARQEYYDQNPTKESRIGNSFRDWGRSNYYNTVQDPHNPWRQTVTKTQRANELKVQGWKIPTAPKKQQSTYTIFTKLVAPLVKQWEEEPIAEGSGSGLIEDVLGDKAGPNCIKVFKKIVSPISIYRSLYMKTVLRNYFFNIKDYPRISNSYDAFKQYIKENPQALFEFFRKNYLSQDMMSFKDKTITPLAVRTQMVKDGIDWDGSDEDDAIVFLIGIKNIQDDLCTAVLKDEDSAATFLKDLTSSTKADKTKAQKYLQRWKNNSNASTKEFFKSQVKYLFENEGAYDRWKEIAENGGNTNIGVVEAAQQEAEQVGVPSPTKVPPPSTGNAKSALSNEEIIEAAGLSDEDKPAYAEAHGLTVDQLNNIIAEAQNV